MGKLGKLWRWEAGSGGPLEGPGMRTIKKNCNFRHTLQDEFQVINAFPVVGVFHGC